MTPLKMSKSVQSWLMGLINDGGILHPDQEGVMCMFVEDRTLVPSSVLWWDYCHWGTGNIGQKQWGSELSIVGIDVQHWRGIGEWYPDEPKTYANIPHPDKLRPLVRTAYNPMGLKIVDNNRPVPAASPQAPVESPRTTQGSDNENA